MHIIDVVQKGAAVMPNTQATAPGTSDHEGQSLSPILEVRDLEVEFAVDDGKIKVLDGVSFQVAPGKTLGIVGESGCGKSVTSLAIMGLLPRPHGQVVGGSIRFQGEELLNLPPEQMYKVRGNRISMIFQEPMTALNPVQTVGDQLMEVFRLHRPDYSKAQRRDAAIAMLQKVGIPEPAQRFAAYPHNLSGGMRQRVMIALAFSCEPELIIADEPTTALDVTVQLQVLRLLKHKARASGTSVLFISHDMAVVSQLCDRMYVMYAGSVIESGATQTLIHRPVHPYSIGLLRCAPENGQPRDLLPAIPGTVPNLSQLPQGCAFRERCFAAGAKCSETPRLQPNGAEGHQAACWYPQREKHHV